MHFSNIKQYPIFNYRVLFSLQRVKDEIDLYVKQGLILEPDFQRNHVWNIQQRSAYIEHILRGGGREQPIIANENKKSFVLLDGLQRLTSCIMFLNNEITAFGNFYDDFEYFTSANNLKFPMNIGIEFGITRLETRLEVLRWYKTFNSSGTIHTKEELEKVDKLINEELQKK